MDMSLPLGQAQAALAADGICWGPPGGPDLLHDISLTVSPGETLAICGPNGAGKSSFLRLIFRHARPRRGRMTLFGMDVARLAPQALARQVAVVLQDAADCGGLTVRQVVELGRLPHTTGWRAAIGLRGAVAAPVEAALARMELLALADRRLATLSGGERQRVMVARALAQEPRLLVLDEPTNHLDIRHQIDLLALLRGLGLTVIVTIHDLTLAAEHADRIAVLHQGRLVACGPPDLALSQSTLATTFRVRARGPLQSVFHV